MAVHFPSYIFLALAVLFPALSIVVVLANPTSGLAFLLVLPGFGAGMISVILFANTFLLEGPTNPSFFDRLRFRRCVYCGHWSVKVVDKKFEGSDTEEIARGPPGGGSGNYAIMTLTFSEQLRCGHCGRTWTRTVTHEQRPPQAYSPGAGAELPS